ncbi:dipeptidase [Notoacmeibacter ruber]|uniref:Dipeptidase n=1 Tax=Notoacmeibacter ruber TaxID=2670375 RepID=A0A3L7JEM6_9HYPH|nr:dipeptidase [Notoacmeibacter ruber]RLQ86932.1 dipeptidase [Notoacmeibacter ruber]
MSSLDSVLSRLDDRLDGALDHLKALIAIPSISTDPDYAGACRQAAEWLKKDLAEIGFEASVRETPGHPMVVAHHDGAGPDAPHALFYGHYDVQPVDPISEWNSDPFQSEIVERDGRQVITGRGAADDKGQLMTFVEACRALIAETGTLPCRVTILFEGEEESGSPSLLPFIEANKEELKADFALVCDTNMWDAETPAISGGLRGLVGEEITIHAADRDLHSGYYGGAAANPLQILSSILGAMHDETGRVTIKNFYEGVNETPDDIKKSWDALDLTPDGFLGSIGLSKPSGEAGRSIAELTWARPTAEINGISGGYTGEGFKTVIPAKATAKVSFRLVHDQDPDAIRENFRHFVESHLPADCTVEFHPHGGSPAVQLPYQSSLLTTAKQALTEEWNVEAPIIGMGGSIPIVGTFQNELGMESLLVGFGLADDRIHSPNEKYGLTSFHKGMRSWARILTALARRGS